ncbi:hypothetical protein AB0J11_19185 [Streptomyces hokutonensis]
MITAWRARHPSVGGHQGKYATREIVNAILYQNRTVVSGSSCRTRCPRPER